MSSKHSNASHPATAAGQARGITTGHLTTMDLAIAKGYVASRQLQGKVAAVWGQALVRSADGEIHPLKVGDSIKKGDVVLTAQDGIVQIEGIRHTSPSEIERIITAVGEGRPEDAPAAGQTGNDPLQPGLRVDRVSESVTPAGMDLSPLTQASIQTVTEQAVILPEPVVATPDPVTLSEDTSATFDPRINDVSGSGARLNIVAVAGQAISVGHPVTLPQGTVSLNDDGTLTFTPALNFNGVFSVNYTVSDGVAPPASSTIAISVTPVNDPPQPGTVPGPNGDPVADANIDPNSGHYKLATPEDTALAGTVKATDPEGDALTFTASQQPTHGTVAVNLNGTWVYTPGAEYNGPDSFSVLVSDGHGGTSIAVVDLNVTPVDDPSIVAPDANTVPEDLPATGNVLTNDSDVDSPLTVTSFTVNDVTAHAGQTTIIPGVGTITVAANGDYTFVPAAQWNGAVPQIAYTTNTGFSSTLDITVSSVSDSPTAGSDLATTPEDTPVLIDVLANDSDPDASTTLVITHINGQAIAVGAPVQLVDASGQPEGQISLTPDGKLLFTPAANFNGPVDFSYTVTDGLTPVQAQVHLAVTPVNDAPKFDDPTNPSFDPATGNYTVATPEDTPVSGQVKGSDVDGDALSYAKASDPAHGTVSVNPDGSWTYTPGPNYNGSDVFSITVSDGHGGTDTATLSISVTGVNDAPVALGTIGAQSGVDASPVSIPTASVFADPDLGDVLTYSATGLPAGLGIDPATGVISGTLASDASLSGPYAITVTASDANASSASQTFTLSVSNPAPLAVADSLSTSEDSPLILTPAQLLANDTDADLDPLSITSVQAASHGSVAIVAGNVVFTPEPNYYGPASFSYTISDGQGGFSSTTVNITVTPVNDAPVASNDTAAVTENASTTLSAANGVILSGLLPSGKDSDVDGDALVVSAVRTGPEAGTGTPGTLGSSLAGTYGHLTLNSDGSYTYVADLPAADALSAGTLASDVFTYTVSDGHGGTDTATLSISVTGVNDAPVALGTIGAQSGVDASPVSIPTASVFADPDLGDVLTYSATGLPAGLGIDPATGVISGTLASDASLSGPYAITVTASDANASSASQTFTLSVSNPAPLAVADSLSTSEDSPLILTPAQLLANDTDADLDPLSITSVQAASHGSVAIVAGNVVFTPEPNYYGPASFSYTISDGQGGFSSTTVNITVTPVNDAPVASNDTAAVTENASTTLSAANGVILSGLLPSGKDSDVDGDALVVSAVRTGPEAGTGTPGTLGSSLAGTYGHLTLNSDGSYTYVADLPAADALSAGTLASDVFTYTVSDGHGGTDTATLSISVTGVNDAPVALGTIGAQSGVDASPVSIPTASVFADPDLGDVLTYSATGLPAGLGIDPATGVISGTLASDASLSGPYAITVTASDANASSASQTFTLSVSNPAPLAVADSLSTSEDSPLILTPAQLLANDTDADLDPLSITSVQAASHGSVAIVAGNVVFTPEPNYYGPASFSYTISDGQGGFSSTTVNITVTPVNDAPVASNDTAAVTENASTTLSAANGVILSGLLPSGKDSDVDGDALVVSAVRTGPEAGTGTPGTLGSSLAGTYGHLTLNSDGSYTYVADLPAADALSAGTLASDVFTYTVSDGHGGTDTATLSISVTGVNDAPVALGTIGAQSGVDASPVSIPTASVFADPDLGDVLTYSATGLPAGLGIDPATGVISGTLASDASLSGPYAITVTASDANASSASQTFTLSVSNPAPLAVADSLSTSEDSPLILTPAQLLANDTDADLDPLSITSVQAASHGSVAIVAGNVVFTPEPNYYGPASFSYTISDGQGGFSSTTVNITVTPVNDAPVASNDTAAVTENASTTLSAANGVILSGLLPSGKDSDVDGDALVVSAVRTGPEAGTGTPGTLGSSLAGTYGHLTLNSDGSYTYVADLPAADALSAGTLASDVFTYTVSDGHGGTDTATLSISVTGVNDAPVALGTIGAQSGVDASPVSIPTASVFADPDLGDVLTYSATGLPAGLGIDPATGVISGTLASDASLSGPYAITVTASDANASSASQTFTLSVSNPAPLAVADSLSTSEDSPLILTPAQLLANDTDADLDPLSITSVQAASHGSVAIVAGNVVFTPEPNYYGPASFSYTISDGQGGFSSTTVNITVTPVNDAPVASNDTAAVTENASTTLSAANGVILSGLLPSGKDSDVDGDALVVSAVRTGPEAGTGTPGTLGSSLAGTYGHLTLNSDGSYTYVADLPAADALSAGTLASDVFTYTVSDGHGGTDTATLSISVTGVNDAPVVGNGTASVSEEGLAGGLPDTTGNPTDTTNVASMSGKISIVDVDSSPTVTLSAPTEVLTSGGVAVTWSGNGTSASPLIGSAGGVEVLRATIDGSGNYTVTLSKAVDQPAGAGENISTLNIAVKASDGVSVTNGTLTVNIEDDAPTAVASTQTVTLPYQDTNIMLMLDISGSMATDADGIPGGPTRLDVMKQSVATMLDQYDNLGNVMVRIVTFSSAAAAYQTSWVTVAQAKTYVNTLTANGNTNYDGALLTAQTAFASPGKIAGATNVSYFLTDGAPTTSQDWDGAGPLTNAIGIQPGEEAQWKSFLVNNQINSFAYGMGTGATPANMDPVAYNGIANVDASAVVVSDVTQLPPMLRDSIVPPAGGSLTDGTLGAGSGIGADGGHIVSFTLNGTTYSFGSGTPSGTNHGTFDVANNAWTVNTLAGGKFVVDMDTGKYTYTAPTSTTATYAEAIGYTLRDFDGDTASSTLTLNVTPPQMVTLTSTNATIAGLNLGLAGEYFGYNETRTGTPTDPLYSGSARLHANDGAAKYGLAGTDPNLNNLADAEAIIEGRGGNTLLIGSAVPSDPNAADASFSANQLEFGLNPGSNVPTFANDLGQNNVVTAGAAVGAGNNLYNFLNVASGNVDGLKAVSGVGDTTDALVRVVGYIYIPEGGTYDLRVTGDDGYRILIGGQVVAQVDQIQSTTVNTFTGNVISEGMQAIEIVYWDQGGNATLRVEVKPTGSADTSYKIIGTDQYALFSPGDAPALAANQDVVETATNGVYAVRTGQTYMGNDASERIVGSDGKDTIHGAAGNDNINGAAGSDHIEGGKGNDVLTGGLGSDTFAWTLADHGSAGAAEHDVISDFSIDKAAAGGDVLDLKDLLVGENGSAANVGNLDHYLSFQTVGASTVIHISSTGQFNGANTAAVEDQTITLSNVDLRTAFALPGAADAQLIQELLNRGKLITDP